MAYRTYVNDVQVFGNNEYYEEWFEFLRKQGIEPDEEYGYDCRITDFMGAIEACEAIVLRIDAERLEERAALLRTMKDESAGSQLLKQHRSLFDLSRIKEEIQKRTEGYRPRLFDELYDLLDSGYLFLPIAFYNACKDDLVLDFAHPDRFRTYKLKPGRTIHVRAG